MHPKMSVNAKYATNTSEPYDTEKIIENNDQISSELIEENIRANLEPLNEHIFTIIQLLNQLIQNNSAKTTPTAGSCTHRPQTGISQNRET